MVGDGEAVLALTAKRFSHGEAVSELAGNLQRGARFGLARFQIGNSNESIAEDAIRCDW
jgi:hypothetical protein